MTLKGDSIKWAIEFIDRHSDGDIFPHIPEISAIARQSDALAGAISKMQLSDLSPQPYRRFLVPKDDLSYRQATQLHPQDSVLLTAIVHQYGEGIESRRLPQDKVFSYRFDPSVEHGLYGSKGLWNDFWSSGAKTAEGFPFILYCDIADFYNQIYHHTVENQLAESGFPNQANKWIINLLEATTQGVSRGIPIGPHAAHLIAECTLIPVDNSLKSSGVEFIRYADDILIFCDSQAEAKQLLYTVVNTLDKQQRLMVQQHKVRIFDQDAFLDHCDQMVQDRPINDDEDKILNIIKKYSDGNPYASVTYNQVSEDDWKAFSEDIVSNIVDEYLHSEETDFVRLRWFLRRLAQVGHSGALQVMLDKLDLLEPCLPSACSYISSVKEIPAEKWEKIGGHLLEFLESGSAKNSEFARLSILSLFSKNEHMDHFTKLSQLFNSTDGHTRREILLAARTNAAADWLREHKEAYDSMDPWQKLAFIYCTSILPRDERRYFLNRVKVPQSQASSRPFEQQLVEWARNGV